MNGSAATMLALLDDWAERGWLRRLDAALARFVADRIDDPVEGRDGLVVVATAITAHLEGQGHTCLAIGTFLDRPGSSLRWSGDAAGALQRLLATLPAASSAWVDALAASRVVGRDPDADAGGEPLVLSGDRLYLRRYWRHEMRVARQVAARVVAARDVEPSSLRPWLDRLFAADGAARDDVDWQKAACAIALRGRLTIVTGGPGTGKTYTAARFLALLASIAPDPARLRIALAAPTGKAAARLRQAIDAALGDLQRRLGDAAALTTMVERIGAARTLHALLGTRPGTRRFRHDAAHPLDVDVVIVDEASMVHVEMMDALLDALPATARVLLLGDKDQLASVEAGAVLGELCRDADDAFRGAATVADVEAATGMRIGPARSGTHGGALAEQTVVLRRSQRFGGAIGALATAVNAGDADAAAASLDADPGGPVARRVAPAATAVVDLAVAGRPGAPSGFRDYLQALRDRPRHGDDAERTAWVRRVLLAFDRCRVLCAVRHGDWGTERLNAAIAERLRDDGLPSATGEWYEGRPVLVTRNDDALGVFNGDIGVALRSSPNAEDLRVWFVDGPGVRSVGAGRLGAVETAFAMTVHKSQGSEFEHTVLALPPVSGPVVTRELLYTGITRARQAFTLVSSRHDALREAVAQTTLRSSGLMSMIDRLRR